MGNILAASEIVELSVQIEINGRDFYKLVAEKSKNNKAKDIFKYLKNEEEKHIETFQKILSSVHKYEPKTAYPQEYFSYMNSLASEYVFTQKDKGKEVAKKVKTDKEAVDLGIRAEKGAITFYEGMKKIVPEEDKKIISKLIKEEENHLKKLTELKENLWLKP